MVQAIELHVDYIRAEILADKLVVLPENQPLLGTELDLEGQAALVLLTKSNK